jgi:predicted TIM-barrel fold metal-dependent hydrolase
VCAFVPGQVALLAPYARRFPRLNIIVDHCGMPSTRYGVAGEAAAQGARYFDTVLALAEHPNVALKWSHAQERFGVTDYPFAGLRPLLRRALEAFGPERVVWASDHTVLPFAWAQLLDSLRDDPELTMAEKAWLLGGALRRLLDWPKPPET